MSIDVVQEDIDDFGYKLITIFDACIYVHVKKINAHCIRQFCRRLADVNIIVLVFVTPQEF